VTSNRVRFRKPRHFSVVANRRRSQKPNGRRKWRMHHFDCAWRADSGDGQDRTKYVELGLDAERNGIDGAFGNSVSGVSVSKKQHIRPQHGLTCILLVFGQLMNLRCTHRSFRLMSLRRIQKRRRLRPGCETSRTGDHRANGKFTLSAGTNCGLDTSHEFSTTKDCLDRIDCSCRCGIRLQVRFFSTRDDNVERTVRAETFRYPSG
jgi:hypothetical protein